MIGQVECGEHGEARPAFVCRHLMHTLGDGRPRGLLWSRDQDGNINAYCDLCDTWLDAAGGEWTDEVEERMNVAMICEQCFMNIARVGGGPT